MTVKITSLTAMFLVVLCVGNVSSAVSVESYFHARYAYSQQYPGVTGVITSGQIVYLMDHPDEVLEIGSKAQLSVRTVGPPFSLPAGAIVTLITMAADFEGVGCTASPPPRQNPSQPQNNGVPIVYQNSYTIRGAVPNIEFVGVWNLLITMTQNTCQGIMAVEMCYGTTPIPPQTLPDCLNTLIHGEFPVFITTKLNRVDNQNRICENSPFNTTCDPASLFGGNLTVTGGLDIHQDQACGATIPCEITGELNMHQDQACGTTTPCEINVHQDEACGATITCLSNANVTSNIIGSNITNTINANAFDWEAFAVKYFPAALAIVMAAVFFRRRDPIFGVIAIALILYSAFAIAWGVVIQTIAMALILYIIVAIIILRKQEKGLQIA